MTSSSEKTQRELRSLRDTVESIWVAIVLAFVLRAFMIEAFVIPTGSMAPELLGEHMDLRCSCCGYEFSFGLPREATVLRSRKFRPAGAVCPSCGKPWSGEDFPMGGDRVLVLKYLYRFGLLGFGQPQPWDVVVFRNPQNNRENYIKRLIGLPGETIEIVRGDVFVANSGDGAKIRRKPRRVQAAIWQTVHDNDYRPTAEWAEKGNPPRWKPDRTESWNLDKENGRVFEFHGGEKEAAIHLDAPRSAFLPYYGYNSSLQEKDSYDRKRDICSDLKLTFTFIPRAADSKVVLILTSFEHFFAAELGADGTAVLRYSSDGQTWEDWSSTQVGPLEIHRGYELSLTNVDLQVALWIGDKRVLFSSDDKYPENYESLKRRMTHDPTPIPAPRAIIAAAGGPCELRHVKLARDVFYTTPKSRAPVPPGPQGDFARSNDNPSRKPWGTIGNPIHLEKFPDRPQYDQFFVLGDNSPQSLDSRAWSSAAPTLRFRDDAGKPLYQLGTVPRYNLIGKAMFVYWPAGFRVPGLPGLPIIPNVGKMRLIR